jgi:hypothetical protein
VRAEAGRAPTALVPALRDAARALDPDSAPLRGAQITESADRSRWFYKVFGTVFVVFGAVAVFMASVGLTACSRFR